MSFKRTSQGYIALLVIVIMALGAAACSSSQPAQTEAPEVGETPEAYPGAATQNPTVNPYPGIPAGQNGGAKTLLTSEDWTPQASDQNMTRGEVDVQESGILPSREDAAVSALYISGYLPTPCNQLRVVVSAPDAQGQILVEAYSVSDPNELCVQVLAPFAAEIPLLDYAAGETSVVVNGQPLQ